MTTTTSLANAKARLSAFVEIVETTQQRVVITKNGEPAAVLISPAELESLEETVAWLSQAGIGPSLAASEAEAAAGPAAGQSSDGLLGRLGKRLAGGGQ
ncbi:MAG: type II toxin-antitoxin system Phd/YefM family antitoxin [Bifidobacteriaceae bacterium]|jgi:prevent-host-death family protein|nr:type II toxin-antitoxin system Phd/YefM family antitoxin [Bifidobacteriaceae bacterium]